jgi:hypothetical protein
VSVGVIAHTTISQIANDTADDGVLRGLDIMSLSHWVLVSCGCTETILLRWSTESRLLAEFPGGNSLTEGERVGLDNGDFT